MCLIFVTKDNQINQSGNNPFEVIFMILTSFKDCQNRKKYQNLNCSSIIQFQKVNIPQNIALHRFRILFLMYKDSRRLN